MPRRLEWRDLTIGALVFGVILLSTAATLKYARIGRLSGDTVRLYTALSSARNIMGGSEVWVNGRKVGRVKSVRFASPSTDTTHRVVLELDVLEKYREQIRENSTASLRTGARLMGSTVVYVTAGTPDARVIAAGDTIPAQAGGDVQGMIASFGEATKEFPAIMANVKVLSSSLSSTRGTIGALTAMDAPKRFEALAQNAARLGSRATGANGAGSLAMRRSEVMARARLAAAQADSLRTLLAGDRSSVGRFRRDSTLLRAVGHVRDELSITRALLSSQMGTLGRFGQDSIIAVQMAEMEKQMTDLFTDIKRRPFRYIAF
jgi:phospholipid/cholesterol/gamma-HCH transport system substrate-binding protein